MVKHAIWLANVLSFQERKAKVTDAWLGRNNKKLNLKEIGLFLREQDSVGEPPKPIPETNGQLLSYPYQVLVDIARR